MKLSKASRCAVQALALMADAGAGSPLMVQRVADDLGLPKQFLGKALALLVQAGILYSKKGVHGGFWLARPANKITVLEVVEAVDGPIRSASPFAPLPPDALTDRLQAAFDDAAERARKVLGRVRISDLAGADGGKKT